MSDLWNYIQIQWVKDFFNSLLELENIQKSFPASLIIGFIGVNLVNWMILNYKNDLWSVFKHINFISSLGGYVVFCYFSYETNFDILLTASLILIQIFFYYKTQDY